MQILSPKTGWVFILSFFWVSTFSQSVGIGTSSPNPSALVDITSTTKGMLVPRMTSIQRQAIGAPAKGLLVFDNSTNSFWFYNGAVWSNLAGTSAGWSLSGNSGTNPATQFVGTTDAAALAFRINNINSGIIDSSLHNTALGYATLSANAVGTGNTSLGYKSLLVNNSGSNNIAIGQSALTSNISGSANVGIGRNALSANNNLDALVAIGDGALSNTLNTGNDVNDGVHNTAIGFNTLNTNTTGFNNTAIGFEALKANSTAPYNTAIGAAALTANTFGQMNTAVGNTTLYQNTTGSQNTSMGHWAMFNNLSGNNNVALGYYALKNNIAGYSNSAIGHSALFNNTISHNNVAVGDSALFYNGLNATSAFANFNTATGSRALFSNTTGLNNVAIGSGALYTNNNGSDNTATGYHSLFLNTSGNNNSAHGEQAIRDNQTGSYNTASGFGSLIHNTTGNQNSAFGASALSTNMTGFNNTGVGQFADVSLEYLSNATALGNSAVVNASNKVRIGNNSVTAIEGPVAYTVSDGRFKKNIANNVPGLDFIKNLKPVTYQYESYQMDRFLTQNNPRRQAELKKEDYAEAESLVHMGFVAQDVERLIREKGYKLSVVHAPSNPTDNYSLAYGELVVPLVKAIQEQQSIIEQQQATIDQQNKSINELLNRMQALEATVKK